MKVYKANLLLLLIGCVLGFFATEILLRIYNPFEFRVKGNKINLPVYFNYKIEIKDTKSLNNFVVHTKNSIGFRGEEAPKTFEDYLTIIAVGGSTTECFLIADGQDWPAILGEKLKKSFNLIWINNAGLDGHSTFGHNVLMQDYIVKIKPKVVLFLVGINDLWRWGVKDSPKTGDRRLKSGLELDLSSIKTFLKTAGNNSEVFALAYNLYRYSIQIHHPYTNIQDAFLEKAETIDIPKNQELEVVSKRLKSFNEKYKKGYSLRLMKLIKISKENGIQPVLITQPALYGDATDDVTKKYLGSIKLGNEENGNIAWESLEFFNDVTRSIGLEQKVLVIDLAHEMPKSSRYFYDFLHYNNEGSKKVGEIVYKNLESYLKINFRGHLKNIN